MTQPAARLTGAATPHGSYAAVVAVVVTSTFLGMLAYTGPLGNAVTLTAAFDATAAETTWILSSMSVGLAVTLLAAGVIADRIGRRRVFMLGALLFVVSNLACALAPDAGVFIAARLVAGAGATGMIATGLGLVVALGEEATRRHTTTASWWSVAMGSGIAVGPLLSGAFDLVDGWRWFYALLTLGGVAMLVGVSRAVPPQPRAGGHARAFDAVGFVLLTSFLAFLVTAIVEVRGGLTPATLALFGVSTLLAVAFVLSQRVGTRRLIEPEILGHRPFLAASAAAFGTGAGIISVMAFAPTYLVTGRGLTTLEAGGAITLWSGTSAIAALILARHSARITGPAQLVIGLVGVALGITLMVAPAVLAGDARLVAGLLLCGVASGLLNGGLARQAVASVPATHAATGTAANNTARYLGAAVGISAASIVGTAVGPEVGWDRVVLAGAGASLLAALLVLVLSRTTPPRRAGEVTPRWRP